MDLTAGMALRAPDAVVLAYVLKECRSVMPLDDRDRFMQVRCLKNAKELLHRIEHEAQKTLESIEDARRETGLLSDVINVSMVTLSVLDMIVTLRSVVHRVFAIASRAPPPLAHHVRAILRWSSFPTVEATCCLSAARQSAQGARHH